MQKEIQLTDKTLLVVGLPKDANRFKMFPDVGSQPYLSYFVGVETHREYVGIGYELLGIYPELTEEQARIANATPAIMPKFGDRYEHVSANDALSALMERENITGYDKYAILIKSK